MYKNIYKLCGYKPNINKAILVTEWPIEWQTENTSNMNIFNIEILFISQRNSLTSILNDIWGKYNKKIVDWVCEWICEWVSEFVYNYKQILIWG